MSSVSCLVLIDMRLCDLGGGVIGLAAAGAMFNNRLSISVAQYAPNLSPETVAMVKQSIVVIGTLQASEKQNVIKAYSSALGTF